MLIEESTARLVDVLRAPRTVDLVLLHSLRIREGAGTGTCASRSKEMWKRASDGVGIGKKRGEEGKRERG
jgi:hypothetical protein